MSHLLVPEDEMELAAYLCDEIGAYDMKHRHAALAVKREAIVGQ